MKKYLAFIALGASILSACNSAKDNNNQLSLTGQVVGIEQGTVYLQKFDDKSYPVVDSSPIVNGTFSFSTDIEQLPEIYCLSLDTTEIPLLVFLDKGDNVSVKLDPTDYYRNSTVSGSALQDLFVAYKQQEEKVAIDSFIQAHPTSLVAAYALYRDYAYRMKPDEIEANIALLDSSLYQTPYVQILRKLVSTLRETGVGGKAPDFTLNTPEGKPVKMSDFKGKSYFLIDFWASWCGPCRRENPNVVNAYQTYHDRGFDILAVSLDKKLEPWKEAIEKDGLTWTHVSDLSYWKSEVAKLYGVRAIPSNVLVDKDGIIIARNLKGEDLQQKLKELYQ